MLNNYINQNEIKLIKVSVVDDIGILFTWRDRLFRAIKDCAVEKVIALFDCGLISNLVDNYLFPKSWITDYKMDRYGLVIEHEKIHPLTYPYEWTFSMLKDAALTVLKVNLVTKKYGYQTKDCHSFNVVFNGLIPKYIDLGSFVKIEDGFNGWVAYEEFLRSFYYPLKIWSDGNSFVAQSIISNESELISHLEYLLYKKFLLRYLNISLLTKLTNLYFKYRRLSSIPSSTIRKKITGVSGAFTCFLKENNLLPFQSVNFATLIKRVKRIRKRKCNSVWSRYQDEYYTSDRKLRLTHRFDRVIALIKMYNIRSVVELGGNQGVLSKLLLRFTNLEYVVCTDYDEEVVDLMYLQSKGEMIPLFPAMLNCMFPKTSSLSELPYERFQADVVIALALTHHLLLRRRLRIEFILEKISRYTKKYILIEFMPLGLWDGTSAPPLPEWYTVDWFRNAFKYYFDIILEEQLEENRILFFGKILNSA